MQFANSLRYHSHWNASYQKKKIIKSVGDNGDKEPLHTVSMIAKWGNSLENSITIPQILTIRTIIWSSHPTSQYTSKRSESRASKRYLYIHFYNSIISNRREVETTQMSIDGWIDIICAMYWQWNII